MNNKTENKELKIELSQEMAVGKYSNLAIIAHSAQEVCVDFVAVMPNSPQAQVISRVIMTPENAKNLLFALRDNLTKYENVFGEIEHKLPRNGGAPQGGKGGDLPNPFMA